jgi:plastocyanin
MIAGGGRRVARVVGAVALAAVIGMATLPTVASAADTTGGSSARAGVSVRVGINAPKDPNVAVLEYLPGAITVKVGAPVTWFWKGTIEPHSVTFFPAGQAIPAPGDTSYFGSTPPTGAYDGTTLVNSGLQPGLDGTAKPLTVTFAKPGKFSYYCVIHPNMVGQVNVVASGKTDSKTTVTERGAAEAKRWVKEGTAAKKKLVSTKSRSTGNSDGTRTWTIQMGASTEHTDVLAFAPTPKSVHAGDHVNFVNNSAAPHTGTFAGKQPPITIPIGPQTDDPAPGPSPQTLNSTDLFNTGLVPPNVPSGDQGAPPRSARTYKYVVPDQGKYPYYCILHTLSGMSGTIKAT